MPGPGHKRGYDTCGEWLVNYPPGKLKLGKGRHARLWLLVVKLYVQEKKRSKLKASKPSDDETFFQYAEFVCGKDRLLCNGVERTPSHLVPGMYHISEYKQPLVLFRVKSGQLEHISDDAHIGV